LIGTPGQILDCPNRTSRRYRRFGAVQTSEIRMTIAIIVVIVLVVVVIVGRFLWVPSRNKKCSRCGKRTALESEVCEHCGHVFHVR
jgi:rRNA maturation endonuclease Nob1